MVFDLSRLFSARRAKSQDEHDCRALARTWCGLISDAAELHERLCDPKGKVRTVIFRDDDLPRS